MNNLLPATSCYLTRPDGLRLHYFLREQPDTHHFCLLLHGFTNDAHMFDPLADQLQTRFNVISLDFRGHGNSDWDPDARYLHEDLINDVARLMQEFPEACWHFIGHSLGARVAILAIAKSGLSPESLTIIDTGPEVRAIGVRKVREDAEATPATFASHAEYLDYLGGIYFLADRDRLKYLADRGLKILNGQLVAKTDPAFTRALWRQDSHLGNSKDLVAAKEQTLWEALDHIHCPCLIVRGQASAILSQTTAEKMQQVITHARLVVVPRAGHALMIDNPDFFEQVVLDFLNG